MYACPICSRVMSLVNPFPMVTRHENGNTALEMGDKAGRWPGMPEGVLEH